MSRFFKKTIIIVLAVVLAITNFGGMNTAQAQIPKEFHYTVKAGNRTLAVVKTKRQGELAIENAKERFTKPFSHVKSVEVTPEFRVCPFDAENEYYKTWKRRNSKNTGRIIYKKGKRKEPPFEIVVKGTISKKYKIKYKTKVVKVKSWSKDKRKVVQSGRNGYSKYKYKNSKSVNGKIYRGKGECIKRQKPRTKIIKKGTKTGNKVVTYAKRFLGCPYRYGGNSLRNGTDCSGFVRGVYKRFGYSLPRTSGGMRSVGRRVKYKNARAGDIICYSGHVAIYMGRGRIIHAASPRQGITTGPARYNNIITVRRLI